jgi:hypothetical protein
VKTKTLKPLALATLICFSVSGCARLKPAEYPTYGFQGGEPYIKEGKRILVVDWIGNFFGVFGKLILWNWKVSRHNITEETEQAIRDYLENYPPNAPPLGNLYISLNRYAPQDSFRRLVQNKGVAWPYKYTIGLLMVIIVDTILIDRLFAGIVAGDHYNPFTHSVHLYSDLPSIALHELGHAKDFAARRYRGSYALIYAIPLVPLYHEYQASQHAFGYIEENEMFKTQAEAYKILYPAYTTYMMLGIWPVVAGHVYGRMKAGDLEAELQRQGKPFKDPETAEPAAV